MIKINIKIKNKDKHIDVIIINNKLSGFFFKFIFVSLLEGIEKFLREKIVSQISLNFYRSVDSFFVHLHYHDTLSS